MDKIGQHYIEKVISSDKYFSKSPVRDTDILFPDFLTKVNRAIEVFESWWNDYKVYIIETYRSDTLQRIYYDRRASKIKSKGMHGFAIAVDCAFKINGKVSYNGDYKLLRQYHVDNGLHILTAWDKPHVQFIPVSQQTELRKTVDKAVRQFQKDNGLTIDGICGKNTIKKAREIYLA